MLLKVTVIKNKGILKQVERSNVAKKFPRWV